MQHMLSSAPPDWPPVLQGRVTQAALQAALPAPAPGTRILVCGRPGFAKIVLEYLRALGYTDAMIHIFS